MIIKEIQIKNFKSLEDISFAPGRVNIFIGDNGVGKTTILEAIGLLAAAMTDRVDNAHLQNKNIRISPSHMYNSQYKNSNDALRNIELSIKWVENEYEYKYYVVLNPPQEVDEDKWEYISEELYKDGKKIWKRNNEENAIRYIGKVWRDCNEEMKAMINELSDYAIYTPNSAVLQEKTTDPYMRKPVGLNGGRLLDALYEIIKEASKDPCHERIKIDELPKRFPMLSNISIKKNTKENSNKYIIGSQYVMEYADETLDRRAKVMNDEIGDEMLHTLFRLCLLIHHKSPKIFSLDNFDDGISIKTAKEILYTADELGDKNEQCMFFTMRNKYIIDECDIKSVNAKVFIVERDKNGYTKIKEM